MQPVPDLFGDPNNRNDVELYYSVYLIQLLRARRTRRVVEACRSIRRYAKNYGRPKDAIFTFPLEMDAYNRGKQNAAAMWRVLQSWDRMVLGRSIKFTKHRWSTKDAHRVLFFYAPVLYLRGHYRLGCELLEKGIKMHSRKKGWSFELLWHVYKPLRRPSRTYDVALIHFYRALRQDVREWELWADFVDDFPAKLFRLSGVNRDDLRGDPALLNPFFQWICNERNRRLLSGTTEGVKDLLDDDAEVKRRQTIVAKKIAALRNDPKRLGLEEEIKRAFPELANLNPMA